MADYKRANYLRREAELAHRNAKAADAIEELSKAFERSRDLETFWEAEANDAKGKLHKYALAVANAPRWIPVEERLPEIKDRYLTVSIEPWFGTTVVDTMRWSGVWMYDGRQTEATVTHWMPLPEPPKEET